MTPYFFTSKMVRTVALTKKTFSKKLVTTIIVNCACYCTAPVNVHLFQFSAVFTLKCELTNNIIIFAL